MPKKKAWIPEPKEVAKKVEEPSSNQDQDEMFSNLPKHEVEPATAPSLPVKTTAPEVKPVLKTPAKQEYTQRATPGQSTTKAPVPAPSRSLQPEPEEKPTPLPSAAQPTAQTK